MAPIFAASEAIGMLRAMLNSNDMPEWHRKQAQEVVKRYDIAVANERAARDAVRDGSAQPRKDRAA